MIESSIMNAELITTDEAAAQMGTNRDALLNWLSRNPEYRPAKRLAQVMLWTQAEIDRAKAGREATRKLAGRQPGRKTHV